MTDKHKPLQEAIRKRRAAKTGKGNLETPIRGSRFLAVGTHDVVILGVDAGMLDTRGLIRITFASVEDREQTHRAQWYVLSKDGSQLSYWLQMLIAALFEDKDDVWLEMAEQDLSTALQVWRGMRLAVTIEPTPGYLVENTPTGYAGIDSQTKQIVTGIFSTIEELRQHAEALGLRRSFHNIKRMHSADPDQNLQALNDAIAGLRASTSTGEAYSLDAHLSRLAGTDKA